VPIQLPDTVGEGRSWKPLAFLGATLVPAFFAGVFALIPNLFERFASPDSKISYSTIVSPPIRTGTDFSRIFSVAVLNEGSLKVTNVDATVAIPVGSIQTASLDQSAGDRPQVSTLNGGVRLTVRSMFPKEKVSITVLVASPSATSVPTVSVRSDQVLGNVSEPSANSSSDLPKWFFLFPAFGAALAAPLLFFTSKRARQQLTGGISREDTISVIITYLDIPALNPLSLVNHDMSFARLADLIFRIAQNDASMSAKCVLALKSLLIVPMNSDSREIVVSYLEDLGIPLDENGEKRSSLLRQSIKNHAQLRAVIKAVFDGSEVF